MCKHFEGYDSIRTDDDLDLNNGHGINLRVPICSGGSMWSFAVRQCELYEYISCEDRIKAEMI